MITAYFQPYDGQNEAGSPIPVLIPEGEILDIAQMAGFDTEDLFSIHIPIGASRESRVKALIAQDNLDRLYNSKYQQYDFGTCLFKWRSSEAFAEQSMVVWLLPPKPIYMVPDSDGVALVEAVDCRYWWKRQQSTLLTDDPMHGVIRSSDGRWQIKGYADGAANLKAFFEFAVSRIGVEQNAISTSTTFFNFSSLTPEAVFNQIFTPEMSLAMVLDIILAQSGSWYAISYNAYTRKYEFAVLWSPFGVESDENQYPSAVAGGLEPFTGSSVGNPLLSLWKGQPKYQINRMPDRISVMFPIRKVEGKTVYDNAGTLGAGELPFAYARDYGILKQVPLSTGERPDYNNTKAELRVQMPVAVQGNDTPYPFNSNAPSSNLLPTSNARTVNYEEIADDVALSFRLRARMLFGRVAWAGWDHLSAYYYGATWRRYVIGRRNGEPVPLMITFGDEKDWLYGPDGLAPEEPRDIVIGKGLVHARRLGSGVVHIEAAPPNTRVFAARITAATRLGVSGNSYWKWTYSFEEMEPSGASGTPAAIGTLARTGTARNTVEEGNKFFAAGDPQNVIATGVKQSDYTNAVIDALPIVEDTVVMMVEQFSTAIDNSRQYWFAVPNAIKVVCNIPLVEDTDFGSFLVPNPLNWDFGTYEAPFGSEDFGLFSEAS